MHARAYVHSQMEDMLCAIGQGASEYGVILMDSTPGGCFWCGPCSSQLVLCLRAHARACVCVREEEKKREVGEEREREREGEEE
jgi:hypothetical protein